MMASNPRPKKRLRLSKRRSCRSWSRSTKLTKTPRMCRASKPNCPQWECLPRNGVGTVLVKPATLKKGDPLVVNGEIYGKARALRNDRGGELETAGPSTPVQIIGFKVAPEIGDILNVGQAVTAVKINIREKTARQTGAEQRLPSVSETESEEEDEEKKKNLNVLIKADVLGSLEAIVGSLEKIKHDEVGVKIVGKGLGNITEDDVARAEAGH